MEDGADRHGRGFGQRKMKPEEDKNKHGIDIGSKSLF
jgi:hypothetical protein